MSLTRRLVAAAALAALVPAALLPAQAPPAPDAAAAERDDRLDWWRDARFGLFIHWGLYAIPAGEWKGSTNHAEWILTTAQIPVAEYEQFTGQFNPVKFDADAWVRMAKDAGMKYIVITSKHHDGFCLFDSAHTDYDVMSTPFKRDIMAELADACRREGLRMCWYHSIMDWNHPDYLPRRGWESRPADGADFDRYVQHLHDQVTELLTNYGDIGVMWFDGEWESTWNHEYGLDLYRLCRELQPDVIVNNRVDKGRAGMAGMTADSKYVGDFGTPEQEIPETGLPGVDWETCMTMNRHWGYNKHDDDWKSATDLIRKLVDIASKGGNFLLNVGPMSDGTFPEESVERLRAIGDWMDVNGESIYGTTASPFPHLPWGRCTVKRTGSTTRLYLHVFDWPADRTLVLPSLGNEPLAASMLASPGGLRATTRDESDVVITLLPPSPPDPIDSVIVLDIEGAPIVYETPIIAAAASNFVRPLDVTISTTSDALAIHYTLNGMTPTAASPRVAGPITVSDTTTVRARAFHEGRPVSSVAMRVFERARPIAAATIASARPGVVHEVYEGDWSELPEFEALTPARTEIRDGIGLDRGPAVEYVGRRFTGYLRVPADDVYLFALDSDDGARLTIAGREIIDNDGLHGPRELRGTIALAAGLHPILVEYFNKTGGAALDLRMAPLGETLTPVAAAALVHE
ncbi:MAG: alpha-L-fucosidase [Planctomycetota bacterium]